MTKIATALEDRALQERPITSNQKTGRFGEDVMARLLTNRRWEILDRNWRQGKFGEIDIVARDQTRKVHFIEVKTRTQSRYGQPYESISIARYRRMRNMVSFWCSAHPDVWVGRLSIDVASVVVQRTPNLMASITGIDYLEGV